MKVIALALAALLTLVVSGLCSEERTVWQIGEFDDDYREFAIAPDFTAFPEAFPDDVVFRVGQDDPSKSWPFIHPGPIDAWAGNRTYRFTILFDLSDEPRGCFRLTVDMVSNHLMHPPVYKYEINSRGGRTALPNGSSDAVFADPSSGREHVLEIAVPPDMLHRGANKLTLECIEQSWAIYDAIRLTNDPDASMPSPTVDHLALDPTVRFVEQDGKLMQVVDLTAQFAYGIPRSEATVTSQGRSWQIPLVPDIAGRVRTEIHVDEVTDAAKPLSLEVAVESGGVRKTASCVVAPQKRWQIYVQPSSHVDIGYTGYQEEVIDLHNRNISLALDLCRDYPDFKWNTEVAWVQDNYLSMMPDEHRDEFILRASEGRIGCQALYGNMLTGVLSHEEIIRCLYYARSMSREHDIPFDIAMISDVPTQVWTLPTVLAGSGIKYFSAGLNLTRGHSFDRLYGKSPFYWEGPDGGKVLTWLSSGYSFASNTGLSSGLDAARQGVEKLIRVWDGRTDYPYDAVLGFGAYSDNCSLDKGLGKTVNEWNKTYAYPRIILSRGPEFFEYIESKFKDRIPTLSGCGGVYWEDGVGSSAAETRSVRRAKESLSTSEKLYAMASILGGRAYPASEIDEAWKNAILYDEHTWGAWCSIDQPAADQTIGQWKYKANFAHSAEQQSESLLSRGLDVLSEAIGVEEESVLVFNPLGWPVSGRVEIERPDGGRIGLIAKDVPPVGYKLYPMSSALSRTPDEARAMGAGMTPCLENRFYRLEIDPETGAVKSLYDKELGRELVDTGASHTLNGFVYISGQGTDAFEVAPDASRRPRISTWTGHGVSRLRIIGPAVGASGMETTITLHDDAKRVDFSNVIRGKEETLTKEAGYFAFPFALTNPGFHVEIPNGVMRPDRDMLNGACMQWYSAQDYVAVEGDGCSIVWSAEDSPLVTIGDINRETFASPLPIENGHLYAYAFNNYWFTNYKASQGGDLSFSFSLTSMALHDPVAAARFGQMVRNPLAAAICSSSGKPSTISPQSSASLCSVYPRNIVIQAVKRAESGDGLVIRLREISGKTTRMSLSLRVGDFTQAWLCNLVEDPQSQMNISSGKVTATIPANGLATILVK